MQTYQEFSNYLGKKTNRPAPSTPRKTRIIRTGPNSIGVKLWDTIIVEFFDDGRLVLDSGGWRTKSTKNKMNQLQSEFYVFQYQCSWFVEFRGDDYLYYDGMLLHPDGTIFVGTEVIKPCTEEERNKVRKKKTKAAAFCENYITQFLAGQLSQPGNDDCWYCSMAANGKPMGDTFKSNHIKEHLKEGYYVPSLFANALRGSDARLSSLDKQRIYEFWEGAIPSESLLCVLSKESLVNILKKYIYKRIGLTLT